jgi:hypothetical protein
METSWKDVLTSIAPFILLLALWFFLWRQMRKGPSSTKKNVIDPMQEMLERVIVPEVRALRQSVDALREEMKGRGQ